LGETRIFKESAWKQPCFKTEAASPVESNSISQYRFFQRTRRAAQHAFLWSKSARMAGFFEAPKGALMRQYE
jgi:hypothetical protein